MLTKDEKMVYEKAMLGFNAAEMSSIFKRSPDNIYKQLKKLYRKHDVHSIQQLMALRIRDLEDQLHSAGVDYD